MYITHNGIHCHNFELDAVVAIHCIWLLIVCHGIEKIRIPLHDDDRFVLAFTFVCNAASRLSSVFVIVSLLLLLLLPPTKKKHIVTTSKTSKTVFSHGKTIHTNTNTQNHHQSAQNRPNKNKVKQLSTVQIWFRKCDFYVSTWMRINKREIEWENEWASGCAFAI